MYLHLPNGVMKVVTCLSHSLRGTLWYPFHASVTDIQEWPGTRRARWKGASAGKISLVQNLLRGDRYTVLRGVPSCLRVITILWHHMTGTPAGTRSMTPRASSLIRSSCTFCCQCNGTVAGVLHTFGFAPSWMWISIGGPAMHGNARWGQVLNVEPLYCSRSHCLIRGTFSGVGGKGRDFGLGKTAVL